MANRGNLQILFWTVVVVSAGVLACRWWVMAQRVPLDLDHWQPVVSSAAAHEGQSGRDKEITGGSGPVGPLNINSATRGQLEQLPGIGRVLADRIVQYRDKHGRFDAVDDLIGVNGIGEKKLAQLAMHVTVGAIGE